MSVEVRTSRKFRKETKRLIRKYPSLKGELFELEKELKANPTLGTPLGHNCYKIRLAVKSKGKGKRGGVRVISHIIAALQMAEEKTIAYLTTIYDKSEFELISDKDLQKIINEIKEENDL